MVTGWHSGIVLARADVEDMGRIPERRTFPDARLLEFGWGDREYYPAPNPGISMALGAAFASSGSVMHLAGYDLPPYERYADARVFKMSLDRAALERLTAAIDATFARAGPGPAAPVAKGLYADSLFFPAQGRFSLANTCNTWTARMLAEAGFDIAPTGIVTASGLVDALAALPGVAAVP